jgi:hypothetical protein
MNQLRRSSRLRVGLHEPPDLGELFAVALFQQGQK